jgi:hypothetical protein
LPFKDAFLKAESLGQWIDSIEIYSENREYQFTLSRDGVVKIQRGSFKEIYPILLNISRLFKEKVDFIKNRSREIQSNYEVKPIQVTFEKDIFSDKLKRT